jgi:hypothetical protein
MKNIRVCEIRPYQIFITDCTEVLEIPKSDFFTHFLSLLLVFVSYSKQSSHNQTNNSIVLQKSSTASDYHYHYRYLASMCILYIYYDSSCHTII